MAAIASRQFSDKTPDRCRSVQIPERIKECLLCRIGGVRVVAHERATVRQRPSLVATHKALKCVHVSCPALAYRFGVVHLSASTIR